MANIFWNILIVVIICAFTKGVPISKTCTNCKLYNLQIHENSPPILVPAQEPNFEENQSNLLLRYFGKKLPTENRESHSNVTEGPDEISIDTTEAPIGINIPVFIQQPQPQSQHIPVILQTYSSNSPAVDHAEKLSDSFSIHISTTIDLGHSLNGDSSIFNTPQGAILGPLVFSTTVQLTPKNVQKNSNNCSDCYAGGSDDEDYYEYEVEGSGEATRHDSTTVSSLEDFNSTVKGN